MNEEVPGMAGTIIGWLLAALASTWGWVMSVSVMGRVEKSERRLEILERHDTCAKVATEVRRDNDDLHEAVLTTQERFDNFTAEIRSSLDATRRELKDDLRMIADLIRNRK